MSKYKKGDITGDGFEVVEVYMKPAYKMRKRIELIQPWNGVEIGSLGWFYLDYLSNFVSLDTCEYSDKKCRINSAYYKFI